MFYTVTFNPAIDYVMRLDRLQLGQTNRSTFEELQPGGKGINVSYVLAQLDVPSVALGFVAGFTGDELQRVVSNSGTNADFIKLQSGNTRINVKIKGDTETEINASGPEIQAADIEKLFEKLDGLCEGDTLILSGSVPPSVPENIYETIMQRLQGKGVRFVVDASRNILLNSLKYRPFLVKPNLAELQETVGRLLETQADISKAAHQLQTMGAENVLVSLGEKGALLLDVSGTEYFAPAITITPVNTVGAGDSMVAGFLAGVDYGYETALRLSIAAGSATAASSGLATKEEIQRFFI